MYKLEISVNKEAQEAIYFYKWQNAYKSLKNAITAYGTWDNCEILFKVFSPKGKMLKSIGLLISDDGTGLEWDNMENEKIRNLIRLYEKSRHKPEAITSHILTESTADNDFPF